MKEQLVELRQDLLCDVLDLCDKVENIVDNVSRENKYCRLFSLVAVHIKDLSHWVDRLDETVLNELDEC